ncbi:thioredoxin domain-containing protein [Shewanella sp. WXL01]|uniref:DUF255 domain-containing protein n=1 Tax=Shewanella sp. WXL01 TaxID=2709721 RepID=UPI001438694B|nr:thioredoxin domain-containing protein [Shewanella sp. WXL01]
MSLVFTTLLAVITPTEVVAVSSAAKIKSFESQKQWLFDNQVIQNLQTKPKFINELIDSDSPYLLSHALQPINWVEWNEQLKSGVADKSKLIFISIGYSTCHWCHVMAQESFDSLEVAELLNESYISVKVDREQWPLVDNHFKSALELLKGEAGWPINAILTPNGQLVWVDSYIDKAKFIKTIKGLGRRWQSNPTQVSQVAKRVEQQLAANLLTISSDKLARASKSDWRKALPSIHQAAVKALSDEQSRPGPRFFREPWTLGLLEEYLRTFDSEYLQLVQDHLNAIIVSPTYDAVEGGFHRYAVDGNWQKPHYEKMLYTQASMLKVLAKLYSITLNDKYRIAIEQTHDWVNQWLKQDTGLASAVSALSSGVEGAYYQVPYGYKRPIISEQDWRKSPEVETLKEHRRHLDKPLVDEKVLLNWNSMYGVGLVEAYVATNQQAYLNAARQLANSLWHTFKRQDTLYRSEFSQRMSIVAQPEDVAWFALLYIHLSEQTISDANTHQKMQTRANWLVEKLVSMLDKDEDSISSVANLNRDEEIPSTRSAVLEALFFGYKQTKSVSMKQLSKQLDIADTTEVETLVSEYSYARFKANELKRVHTNYARFANGNGRISLSMQGPDLVAKFAMNPGWHINANLVSNKRYLATVVEVDTPQQQNIPLSIVFPESLKKHLAFDEVPLNLFENKFEVIVSDYTAVQQPSIVSIQLQACSDSLCLLPEKVYLLGTVR